MKTIVLLVFAFFSFTLTTRAQTSKNWYLIGGSISNINLEFQKSNTTFGFDITPRVAWFIKDNIAVGAQALMGFNTGDGYTTSSYGIGPIARYYFADRAIQAVRKTRWFLDGNVGFHGTNTKVSGEDGVSTNGLGIGFGPGLAYFINQNIALEVLPKYNLTVGFGNATTDNALNISIGLQVYLPRAKLNAMKNDIK